MPEEKKAILACQVGENKLSRTSVMRCNYQRPKASVDNSGAVCVFAGGGTDGVKFDDGALARPEANLARLKTLRKWRSGDEHATRS